MKNYIKISILFFLFSVLATISLNARNYGMAGCGLGTLILDGKNNTTGNQLLISTSNYSLVNTALSGITTGTSNCTTDDGIVKDENAQEVFVHLNYDSLEKEMAVGKGDKLETLAILFGCSRNKNEFLNMTKRNYTKLFSKKDDPSNLYMTIRTELQNDQTLKNSCQL